MKSSKRSHTATQYWNAVAAELRQYGFGLSHTLSGHTEDSFFATYSVIRDGVTVLGPVRAETPRLYLLPQTDVVFARVTDEKASLIVFEVDLRDALPQWVRAAADTGMELTSSSRTLYPDAPEVRFHVTSGDRAANFALRIPVDEVLEASTRDAVLAAACAALGVSA